MKNWRYVKELKEEIKSLKTDQKLQESLLSTWADIHNQIEETEVMIEGLERVLR